MPGFLPLGISRFQAFLAIQSVLTDRQYWKTLREAYVSSDDLYHYQVDIGIAFRSNRSLRENLMNAKEKKLIDASFLKDRIKRSYLQTYQLKLKKLRE